MLDKIDTGRWWDLPWGLTRGCTRCSPGCQKCWALAMEKRFYGNECAVEFMSKKLDVPVHRRKPTAYAVWNDLYHEAVTLEQQDLAWRVMNETPRHVYFVLTKRPNRMLDHVARLKMKPQNVWLGVTVCNQDEVDRYAFWPTHEALHGFYTFVSVEPMLGAIDLSGWLDKIYWCIAGGESGVGGRVPEKQWVLDLEEQCYAAHTPMLWKQWGPKGMGRDVDGETITGIPTELQELKGKTSWPATWI